MLKLGSFFPEGMPLFSALEGAVIVPDIVYVSSSGALKVGLAAVFFTCRPTSRFFFALPPYFSFQFFIRGFLWNDDTTRYGRAFLLRSTHAHWISGKPDYVSECPTAFLSPIFAQLKRIQIPCSQVFSNPRTFRVTLAQACRLDIFLAI